MNHDPYQSPVSSMELGTSDAATPMKMKQILFSFTGRIPRKIYWFATVATTVISMLLVGLIAPLLSQTTGAGETVESPLGILLVLLVLIPLVWTSLAIRVKRWHDLNKSGTWVLIGFIPVIGPIISLIYCGCTSGTAGPNTYGTDPL